MKESGSNIILRINNPNSNAGVDFKQLITVSAGARCVLGNSFDGVRRRLHTPLKVPSLGSRGSAL